MKTPLTPEDATFPMRLNRYLAKQGIATRREADALIEAGRIIVNGQKAVLGMKISETDQITVENANRRHHTYLAYYKPRGIITHSPQGKREYSIADVTKKSDLFPIRQDLIKTPRVLLFSPMTGASLSAYSTLASRMRKNMRSRCRKPSTSPSFPISKPASWKKENSSLPNQSASQTKIP